MSSAAASMWKAQRGLCALTRRRLTRENAHLDHVWSRARGGGDSIENLRWTVDAANLAKRDMSDAEFFALCLDVVATRGALL